MAAGNRAGGGPGAGGARGRHRVAAPAGSAEADQPGLHLAVAVLLLEDGGAVPADSRGGVGGVHRCVAALAAELASVAFAAVHGPLHRPVASAFDRIGNGLHCLIAL